MSVRAVKESRKISNNGRARAGTVARLRPAVYLKPGEAVSLRGVAMTSCRSFLLVPVALLALTGLSCSRQGDTATLQGCGGTFPAPLYKRWFLEYYRRHPEVRTNYQAIGSG